MTTKIYKGEQFVIELNYEFSEFKKEWFEEWEEGMQAYPNKFEHPILENGNLREMTREERALHGETNLLRGGEKIVNGNLITIERPKNLYRPVWDRELEEWKEGATSAEILIERKNVLLEAKSVKQEIKDLEEIAEWGLDDDLDSFDTIKMLQEKFDVLITKAKELTKIYKKLKNKENEAI